MVNLSHLYVWLQPVIEDAAELERRVEVRKKFVRSGRPRESTVTSPPIKTEVLKVLDDEMEADKRFLDLT